MARKSIDQKEIFYFIMIKPTHYRDDGYLIQWLQSPIPANSLASVNGLAEDCASREVLGKDVEIRLMPIDETNKRVGPDKLIAMIRRDNARALIGLVGVQSNQFPRAMDLAQPFLEANLPVCFGGFHVSGCLSMLPDMPPDLKEAQDRGISFFAGEAEGLRLDDVLIDAHADDLKPVYNYLADLPGLSGEPTPILPLANVKKTAGAYGSFDIGRGCPFECSFCTIINVQGRKSRFRTADDLERIIRDNNARGVHKFFVTDDNLARNKNWEELFDRLIKLREEDGISIRLAVQVDTLCHQIPGFIEKAVRAGVQQIFLGLENINPDNLASIKKRQNKITEYREMLLAWKNLGVMINAGYIIGFEFDTKESVRNDIEILKRELPVDVVYFMILTPLPGSEDHLKLYNEGKWMDPDMNKYDLHHTVSDHPTLTREEWQEIYRVAWDTFYTPEHMETVLRRLHAAGVKKKKAILNRMGEFYFFAKHTSVHPLEGGYFPLKYRRDRRSSFKLENPLVFYRRYFGELFTYHFHILRLTIRLRAMRRKVANEPNRRQYTDASLVPPDVSEYEDLELYTSTRGGAAAVEKQQKIADIRKNIAAAAE